MSRAVVWVTCERERQKALKWLSEARLGFITTFKRNQRSVPQNDRMWAMLTDVSNQVLHHGIKYSPEDWKLIFMAGLNQELRLAPNLDGDGLVQLGRSTSKLTVPEMGDLMTLIEMHGAKHGVEFADTDKRSAA